MKTWLLALGVVTCASWVSADDQRSEHSAQAALPAADKSVDGALNQMHRDRQSYLTTVQTSGKDSPQAAAAKTRLDSSRAAWRTEMNKRQDLRHQARREIMHKNRSHGSGR